MAKAINYRQLMHKAFRTVMAEVLSQVAREGLPGKHHFFITFDTTHPGVDMSPALRARYPKEMTIVLQEWFADLAVMKDRFRVTLNFGDVPEPIVVPFMAVRTFVDPWVEFGFRVRGARGHRRRHRRRRPSGGPPTPPPPLKPKARSSASTSSASTEPDRRRRYPPFAGGVNGSFLTARAGRVLQPASTQYSPVSIRSDPSSSRSSPSTCGRRRAGG